MREQVSGGERGQEERRQCYERPEQGKDFSVYDCKK